MHITRRQRYIIIRMAPSFSIYHSYIFWHLAHFWSDLVFLNWSWQAICIANRAICIQCAISKLELVCYLLKDIATVIGFESVSTVIICIVFYGHFITYNCLYEYRNVSYWMILQIKYFHIFSPMLCFFYIYTLNYLAQWRIYESRNCFTW